ncbi:FAD/NAD(P)-binding protein [Paeniglutamicibacter kerguelensis]|uniref:FAD-dependent urate hydroxylase HpyO/Asp monooxygenase CreE-like FAD/NAD(P)-binding domain-containing protein n=1 Tax=Paeniglutamicibacter kerguelensis TaxID=254788 RepID=A0ABS4XHH3_9MICC|nr:FAD/NAD(P)-binding protein [Paeniglutamicibacter kerguelensis]MBP2387922.1 hypothetical protein [Paeniglutamicibacter kerguelensis]
MTEAGAATIRIAIVGAGPRGISVLERLSANSALAQGVSTNVTLFDPFEPGGGRVWASAQPQHLLMNTLCADATHFTDRSVQCEGPIVEGPNLYEWSRMVANGTIETVETGILAESSRMEPHRHPSRKILGHYLEWCYDKDLERLPENFTVAFEQREVTGLRRVGARTIVETESETYEFDVVVIATGHTDSLPNKQEAANLDFAADHGLYYGLPSNPISQDLSSIQPGSVIAVRGLGMNFFDYVSLLTEGRGGRFVEEADGSLTYLPSGQEPILLAGSRRGVPYRAKGLFGQMTPQFAARYLTPAIVENLASQERQLNFLEDLWPLAVKDAAYTYYRVLSEQHPEYFAGTFGDIVDGLDSFNWESAGMEAVLASAVPNQQHRIDFGAMDKPLAGKTFSTYDSFLDWWKTDLAEDYEEAVNGFHSATKCAAVAIGAARGAIRRLARYGGFTGDSYAKDVQGWIRGFAGSVASGPPARRINELKALVEAEIVCPLGPDMVVERSDGCFKAFSPAIPGIVHECVGLLEAHLPGNHAARSSSSLLRQIVEDGTGRLFQIPNPGQEPFISGALEVGHEPYALIAADGTSQEGIYVVGVPLESIHWGTQLGPLAHTNSRFLRDNDAVARAAINFGRTNIAALESAQRA